jgi:hypothetical protein
MINEREFMDALRWLDVGAITEALLQDCRIGLHQEADSRLVQAVHASFGVPLPPCLDRLAHLSKRINPLGGVR